MHQQQAAAQKKNKKQKQANELVQRQRNIF